MQRPSARPLLQEILHPTLVGPRAVPCVQGGAGWLHPGRSGPTTSRLEAQLTATDGFPTGGIVR